jgi:hypothetical protein
LAGSVKVFEGRYCGIWVGTCVAGGERRSLVEPRPNLLLGEETATSDLTFVLPGAELKLGMQRLVTVLKSISKCVIWSSWRTIDDESCFTRGFSQFSVTKYTLDVGERL